MDEEQESETSMKPGGGTGTPSPELADDGPTAHSRGQNSNTDTGGSALSDIDNLKMHMLQMQQHMQQQIKQQQQQMLQMLQHFTTARTDADGTPPPTPRTTDESTRAHRSIASADKIETIRDPRAHAAQVSNDNTAGSCQDATLPDAAGVADLNLSRASTVGSADTDSTCMTERMAEPTYHSSARRRCELLGSHDRRSTQFDVVESVGDLVGRIPDVYKNPQGVATAHSRKPRRQPSAVLQQLLEHLAAGNIMPTILNVNDAYSEYNYALVSVYSFSRWPTVVPLRTKSAQEVAFALLNIFADRHVPHMIRNDKGHEFEAEVDKLCDLFGIRRVLVNVGTSNSNGIVGRLHREVNAIITRFVNGPRDEGSDWIQLVPAIHVHLRRQVNASTGCSPTEPEHVRNPTYSSAMDTELTTEHHTFEDGVTIEGAFFEAAKLLRQRRQKALANDIATRDVRLRRQNRTDACALSKSAAMHLSNKYWRKARCQDAPGALQDSGTAAR